MKIYEVTTNYGCFKLYFTTIKKAQAFIKKDNRNHKGRTNTQINEVTVQ